MMMTEVALILPTCKCGMVCSYACTEFGLVALVSSGAGKGERRVYMMCLLSSGCFWLFPLHTQATRPDRL